MTLLATCVLSIPAPSISAEVSMRTVDVYQGLATLEIPTDWHEIPSDLIEFYALESAEASGGRLTELYQHGFRPGDPENDFELPQILIQIKESGRLKYGQFLHLPPIESLREQGEATLQDRGGAVINDARVNNVSFDREDFSLRMNNTIDFQAAGKTIVASASFLTERGLFTVHCYAHISQNIDAAPIFDRVIDSVRIDKSIRYQPRISDRLPPMAVLVAYSVAAILAAAIFITLMVLRRRRSA